MNEKLDADTPQDVRDGKPQADTIGLITTVMKFFAIMCFMASAGTLINTLFNLNLVLEMENTEVKLGRDWGEVAVWLAIGLGMYGLSRRIPIWQQHRHQQRQAFVAQVAQSREVVDEGLWSAKVKKRGWNYRCLDITTPEGKFIVEYDTGGLGDETVFVDGEVASRPPSKAMVIPRFEFKAGTLDAVLEVRLWPWLAVRSMKLTIDSNTVYKEGTAA